ncbi:hypothetical protein H5410_055753, partial [Solanum commersonii]
MEIRSSKLKTLKLQSHWKVGLAFFQITLEIFAPYLQHLEISGNLYDLRCMLFDVSAVVTAKLTFTIMCIKDILNDHGQEFDPQEDSCHDYHQFSKTLILYYLLTLRYTNKLSIATWFTELGFPKLKNVKITNSSGVFYVWVPRYVFQLAEKLLGCPRLSTTFVIIFQKWAFHDLSANSWTSFLSHD